MLRDTLDAVTTFLAPKVDPHALHKKATMEGFFTHVHSPSSTGNPYTIIIIFCEVEHAIDPNSRIMVWVLYAPGHIPPQNAITAAERQGGFFKELCSSGWKHTKNEHLHAQGDVEEWKIQVENIGTMEIRKDRQLWTIHIPADPAMDHEAMELVVETTTRTPWTTRSAIAGPEGPIERLGILLPLHWHIFSTASRTSWQLRRLRHNAIFPESQLNAPVPEEDIIASGTGTSHIEKNHGVGFPTAWIWAHSISPSKSSTTTLAGPSSLTPKEQFPIRFAMAGGKILGIEAYLLGFRDDERNIAWDFTPPFAMGLGGIGPGLRTFRSWKQRKVSLSVWDWGRWLEVEMSAPADTFIPMPGPLSKGFAPDLCHESFQARFKITLRERRLGLSWKRPWSFLDREEWQWRQIGQYEVEEAALEFGGDYVGEESRGSKVHGE